MICRYTLLRMRDFTASIRTYSFGLFWVPDTIEKEQGMSPEEGRPQACMTAKAPPPNPYLFRTFLYVCSQFRPLSLAYASIREDSVR